MDKSSLTFTDLSSSKVCHCADLFYAVKQYIGVYMKVICPNCQSDNVYEVTGIHDSSILDNLCSPLFWSSMGVKVCKSYKANPMIGIVAGTLIATAMKLAKDKYCSNLLVNSSQQYCCADCSHVFNRPII